MRRPLWDTPVLPQGDEKVRAVREMFDAIAPRYDVVNRLMTFGLDVRWRRRAVEELCLPRDSLVLDLASGTGDLCVDLAAAGHRPLSVDFSLGMLQADLHNWDNAEDAFRQCLELCEARGDRPLIASVLVNRSEVSCALARYDEAIAACYLAISISEETGADVQRGEALRWKGHALSLAGRHDAAEAASREVTRSMSSALQVRRRRASRVAWHAIRSEHDVEQSALGAALDQRLQIRGRLEGDRDQRSPLAEALVNRSPATADAGASERHDR